MRKTFTIALILFAFNSLGQLPNTLTPADKVYGLSKFWQEVNYNFVYLDKVDRAMWDSTYKQLIIQVQDTKNDYEYYRELQKFCALLKDGHTNIYMPENKGIEVMTTMFGSYRMFVENIDGKAIIVRTNLSKKYELPVGSEIVEVNGKSTKDYLKEQVTPYISSSTDYVLEDISINNLLQGLKGDQYQVKIKRPKGDIITLNLTHETTEEKEVYPNFEEEQDLLEFKWLANQTAYIGLNSFSDPQIDTLFKNILPELYKAKALVIDLRSNGGGNTSIGRYILEYLTNDKVIYGSKSTSRLHIPSFKAWGAFRTPSDTINNEWAKRSLLTFQDKGIHNFDYAPYEINLGAKRIVVPTAVLIGHNTASAADDFLIYADNQKHFTKIGENTYGSTGQPFIFALPGGGSARICTKKDTYPDGREFVGYGIKPDIIVKPSLNDYLLKKDPVLDKAVSYLNTQMK